MELTGSSIEGHELNGFVSLLWFLSMPDQFNGVSC